MSVSNEELKLIGKCSLCEINVYDRGKLNKPFIYLGKQRLGFPREVAMPCGLNRTEGRCPFETKKEQEAVEFKKGIGIFSGQNMSDNMG